MPSFTIFNIGTGHGRDEEYNLLVDLFNQTDATEIRPPIIVTQNENYKVINNGPGYDCLLDSLLAQKYMNTCAETAVDHVAKWQSGPTDVVNMVGHSRGAILCIFMAWWLKVRFGTGLKCNLFLIDPVSKSNYRQDEGRTLYGNVVHCCRITMEDDKGEGAIALFPLQAIDARLANILIQHYRLPGTHGTATQFSPHVATGMILASTPLDVRIAWPIGAVAKLEILRSLCAWGTPLTATALTDAQNDWLLLETYSRIIATNQPQRPALRTVGLRATVNDLDPCKAGSKQRFVPVRGTRTEVGLEQVSCPNPYRGRGLFVNQQHKNLLLNQLLALHPNLCTLANAAATYWAAGGTGVPPWPPCVTQVQASADVLALVPVAPFTSALLKSVLRIQ